MTKITKSIVSITLTTIMITSTMAIKANAANTNQELKWRNVTKYTPTPFNPFNKTYATKEKKETVSACNPELKFNVLFFLGVQLFA